MSLILTPEKAKTIVKELEERGLIEVQAFKDITDYVSDLAISERKAQLQKELAELEQKSKTTSYQQTTTTMVRVAQGGGGGGYVNATASEVKKPEPRVGLLLTAEQILRVVKKPNAGTGAPAFFPQRVIKNIYQAIEKNVIDSPELLENIYMAIMCLGHAQRVIDAFDKDSKDVFDFCSKLIKLARETCYQDTSGFEEFMGCHNIFCQKQTHREKKDGTGAIGWVKECYYGSCCKNMTKGKYNCTFLHYSDTAYMAWNCIDNMNKCKSLDPKHWDWFNAVAISIGFEPKEILKKFPKEEEVKLVAAAAAEEPSRPAAEERKASKKQSKTDSDGWTKK